MCAHARVHVCVCVCVCKELLEICACWLGGMCTVSHYEFYVIVQAVLQTIFQTVSMDQWMTESMLSHKQLW